ncbi:methyl-CpG-binding domain-containing protein 9 isoform X2 [Vitis vinifera]|uniref:methyl-CpG-binding domain-containing protein 9 isoform X2 n=1 Tax=Vitis vinifera TaxID=29760 RepID=UPI00053F6D56|nr:methyl-CpG-binding domain-containing protein 9 isoform X2 [Vitis vinifera]|eukprot:XP_010660930.1 PREDICTED: methyl-CpG-binding domain-containing protein 9 isoform X3 [Vitis vinifera]
MPTPIFTMTTINVTNLKNGLPVQFEDFFVLSLGEVDVRPSYHDVNQLWPVGYKSCWHDKLTGSLFMCDVSDGGDSGPIFKVKRCACSAIPLPNGSTVLCRPNLGQSNGQDKEKSNDMISLSMDYDEDGSLQTLLADPSPPMENDILSCIRSSSNGSCCVQTLNSLLLEDNSLHESSGEFLSDHSRLKDEIGEFSLQGRSSSSVWNLVSQKFIDACCETYKRTGSLRFFCEHVKLGASTLPWDIMDESSKGSYTSLDKFCSSPGSVCMPSVIQGENELQTQCEVLAKWLDQDRFGLDVEFVQEMLEQLPGVCACSQYKLLNNRSYHSTLLTVGNGLLLAETENGVQSKGEEALDCLFGGSKRARKYTVGDPLMDDFCPPPGNPLGSRLPPDLVGDVIQVWESLWRFYEILGLKEPFSIEELEEELICPWSDDLNLLEKFGTETQENRDITPTRPSGASGHIPSSSTDSGPEVSTGNPHAFIQMETGQKKEAAQAKLASVTYSRCSGVTLTKAHNSLLKVLVSELQFKVAALVDPNFDSGESKSRRGRKKDADNAIPTKKTKLNMLPINELTWPELARRYILCVLSMDGNLDSAEITIRESGKVFRCLQGDGGVLCDSLTGVAGMQADALLFAEARKQIFGSLNREDDILTIEEKGSDATGDHDRIVVNDGNIPEWAQVLEPVRKLPTNVGTRIRKCIYEALEKDPPEWAKKILAHSISKEVYKGNASGPTKKAVLSVLGIVHDEGLKSKPDKERKRKRVISIPDIIMKQCRITLRRGAAADDAKVFCTLLGSKLINSIDNDDEGLLGTPAMVSRPLDFRTIDLRLAVGAYGGSWETFLEDVRELWNNIHTAYADQPDSVELARTLSQNFESMFEKEVLPLVQKFTEYAKSECLSAETEKEIDDFLVSASEIPKAPWDEGVCKVCGIDKDDDSVLLCDMCDAEYHTYCLNPPLARIPEGNWYCPSCVAGISMVDVSEHTHVIAQRQGKNCQGDFTHAYLESLAHLAAAMEEKEYWELSVDQRTFLFKFLCDELLNTALIRQHLEQCAESSAELQQKLRSISVEWKNLKLKEENLAARAPKVDSGMIYVAGEVGTEGGLSSALTNNGKCIAKPHTLSDRPKDFGILSNDQLQVEGGSEGIRPNGLDKHPSSNCSEGNCTLKPIDNEGQLKEVHAVVDETQVSVDHFPHMVYQGNGSSCRPNELHLQNPLQQEMDGLGTEFNLQVNMCENMEKNDLQGLHHPSDIRIVHVAEHDSELNSIKNDISDLQDSMASIESQLLKLSVRREFLGSDSAGRLYWILAKPGWHPWVLVDGSMALQKKEKMRYLKNPGDSSVQKNSTSLSMDILSTLGGSNASCPFLYRPNASISICSQWVSYQSGEEIDALIGWLKDADPREKELKESILHLHKLRFRDWKLTGDPDQVDSQTTLSRFPNSENAFSDGLLTKAGILLGKKYGPWFEPEIADSSKKWDLRSKVTNESKMYRCECLEPIWSSRHHCPSCHRTFFTDIQLEEHNDGSCRSGPPTSEKSKENSSHLKGKGTMKSKISREESTGDIDMVEIPKGGCSQPRSRLIKFQNEGLVCPYDFEEICSKFVTKNSNKELVQEIGLIGSKGVPSFVSSRPPYISDATLLLVPSGELKATGDMMLAQGNRIPAGGSGSFSDNSSRDSAANETSAASRTDKSALEQKDKKYSLNNNGPEMEVGRCCVIPQSSLRPLVGKVYQILRQLKINLLDMDAALPEEALKPSRADLEKRLAWRAFVKSAETIFEMVQATIMLEDMIKTEYLMNGWWYWSSLSAAAKTSTVSSLALRIYSLDAAIAYEKISSNLDLTDSPKPSSKPDPKPVPNLDTMEKSKLGRKQNKRRKESEG